MDSLKLQFLSLVLQVDYALACCVKVPAPYNDFLASKSFHSAGWRRQNVRQLALASACYLCGRPGDEVPSQCGVFVKPYKVLCTAHGLPTNARIGTKVVAFISGGFLSNSLPWQ